ncbi:hypothetical protein RFI_27329 [Reticulomyxa filosa]|uniref:Uncharacterized protein n=1 Tax=Reticulomyxa filosa TaxID=46433 RepID=X6M991_RETFI|nr:hypothetical protein RFI_27329 [Reticulomyxa filosa]|eukprot:ETO10047.1 hypothetical protein RFI_27329 [Reticulomyxa filosa]
MPGALIDSLQYCNVTFFKRTLKAETIIISTNTCIILCDFDLTSLSQTTDDIQALIGRTFRCFYQYTTCHILICVNDYSPYVCICTSYMQEVGKSEFFQQTVLKLVSNLSNVFKDFNIKIHTIFYPSHFLPVLICDLIQREYPMSCFVSNCNATTQVSTANQSIQQVKTKNFFLSVSINPFLTEFETNEEAFLCSFPSINSFVAQMMLQHANARVTSNCLYFFFVFEDVRKTIYLNVDYRYDGYSRFN